MFNPVFKGVQVQINTLSYTTSSGLDLSGMVEIDREISIKAATIKDIVLTFDTGNDAFGGGATMEIKRLVTISGNASILMGKLNSVTLSVELANPVPIDATGLALKGGTGSVQHISDSQPILFILTVDITGGPSVAGSCR